MKYYKVLDEKAERLIEKYLKAIIECSFDGIYITDGKANTWMINEAYERITGLDSEKLLGENMWTLMERGIISSSGSLLAIAEKRIVTLYQTFSTGKRAMITSTPIFDDDGEIVLVETNVRDLTEICALREQAERDKNELEQRRQLEFIKEKKVDMVVCDENTIKTLLLADSVARMDTTVVLCGESGVGKEVFAKYIRDNSRRKDAPYVKVNCGAIPENLIESELFGYEKGSFTGANKNGKIGLFEMADHGTIFLDEIGELPLNMQVKLLRVLQEQEIERIGGTKPIKIDVRVIAATNRNLEKMMEEKKFREDLYYRLMVFPIHIPALRERKKDIEPLAEYFLKELNKRYKGNKNLSENCMMILENYQWPGNVRELKNIVERAFIISQSDEITTESIPITDANAHMNKYRKAKESLAIDTDVPMEEAIKQLEMIYMDKAFEKYGNVRDAAESLGMSASTFVRKRQKYQE
mgnify:CR=1 FL=1